MRRLSQTMPALVLADRDPDPLGGGGHVDMVDFVFAPQPLDDRIDHRRAGADRAGLAGTFDAERIGRAGNVVRLEHKGRAVGRARQRVIHERSGHELAIGGIVDRLLHQGLADALHRAAVYLAGEQQRIEGHPEIIDDDVVDDSDDAGGRIDFDLGDMRAVRKRPVGTGESCAGIQL